MYCIYRLNFPNGESYIGSTNNIKRRITQHKSNVSIEKWKHLPVYECIKSNPNFEVEVLLEENCEKEVARQLEQKFIENLKPTLNCKNAYSTLEQKKEYDKKWKREDRKKWNEEKREEHKAICRKNNKQKVHCECGISILKNNILRHKKTKIHMELLSKK